MKPADLGLSLIFHNPNLEVDVVYHGSPVKINDRYIASGTFFSVSRDIAKEYGRFIYSIELAYIVSGIFQPDILKEHLINSNAIPISLFDIEDSELDLGNVLNLPNYEQ